MNYVLGLDLGITSVGWAVINLDRKRIESLGVRAFNKAEDPEKGASLALPRRLARNARRRLRRRRGRLDGIIELFQRLEIISTIDVETIFLTAKEKLSPWELRLEGLDRLLNGEEMARALYHLAKHRGFQSNRKMAKQDDDEGLVKSAIQANRQRMTEKGYRTVGEMYCRDETFFERKRNSTGNYLNLVDRSLLDEEVRIIFNRQRALGSRWASVKLEDEFLALFRRQKPVASGEEILQKVGACTFEKQEKRAPTHCYSTERFMLLEKLNHLGYETHGEKTMLTMDQRVAIEALAYHNALKKSAYEVTYREIRRALALPEDARFVGMPYRTRVKGKDVDPMECEKKPFVKLTGYHELHGWYAETNLWENLADDIALLDLLGYALTVYKNEDDLRKFLQKQQVPDQLINIAVQAPGFAKFGHLSLKALHNILPFLEKGLIYSDACTAAGYTHSGVVTEVKFDKLPPLNSDDVRNPVVFRALTQARKVVNAVIDRYGAPFRIQIEMARDMGRSFEARKEIEREIEENRRRKDADISLFQENFPKERPTGESLLKFRLYKEQCGQCAYSQQAIDLQRLMESGYVEIDHILPYSRSFDDSYSNKVLVFTTENRNKLDRTPIEYLNGQSTRLASFIAWVEATIINRRKRENLLNSNFSEEKADEWKKRHLNDTGYIASFFRSYLADNLKYADPANKLPVICVNGQITAMARGLWGLKKEREKDDLHHALDAVVVATITPGQVQRITAYHQARERWATEPNGSYVDPDTGEEIVFRHEQRFTLPQPWSNFRKELLARLSAQPAEEIAKLSLESYEDEVHLTPLLVSRMPLRRLRGSMHKDTIRSVKHLVTKGVSTIRIPLTELNMLKFAKLIAPEQNVKLYTAIRERLESSDGNGRKAFGDPANPLRKPTNDGLPGPIVRSVKLAQSQPSGFSVRGGIAGNGEMIFLDVFLRNSKFYLAPAYVSDAMAGILPSRVIVAGKAESDWPVIDESFRFLFRLYPFDLVKIETKRDIFFGYYRTVNRNTGKMTLCQRNKADEPLETCVTTAISLEKYSVDMLGACARVKDEVRCGLESRRHQPTCEPIC